MHPTLVIALIALAVVLLLVFSVAVRFGAAGVKEHLASLDPKAKRILFIGNSLTFGGKTPEKFARLLEKNRAKEPFVVKSFTWPGYTISDHLALDSVKKLLTERWNYIVLQPDSAAPFRGLQSLEHELDEFSKAVADIEARIILVMTPADKGCFATQCIISRFYRYFGKKRALRILPDGDLVFFLQQTHPEIELYDADNHHPSDAGGSVYALILYKELFGESQSELVLEGSEQSLKVSKAVADEYDAFQSALLQRPEFCVDSGDYFTDLAALWSECGQLDEALRLARRRLYYAERLFPSHDNSAYAIALKSLADVQFRCPDDSVKAEARSNYHSAREIFSRLPQPDFYHTAEIDSILRREQHRTDMKRLACLLLETDLKKTVLTGRSREIVTALKEEQLARAAEFSDEQPRSEEVEISRRKLQKLLLQTGEAEVTKLIPSLNHELESQQLKLVFDPNARQIWVARNTGSDYQLQFSACTFARDAN